MTQFDFTDHSHKRFNPLNNSWVLCSPHRAKRPWLGQVEKTAGAELPEYLPDCFLCPRNKRVNGDAINPDYANTFVFPNDFPAVKPSQPEMNANDIYSLSATGSGPVHDESLKDKMSNLFRAQSVTGCARVICFSPLHNVTMAEMTQKQIVPVIDEWIVQMNELRVQDGIGYVQIFENKGAVMGCSNPHPHGQIWATLDVPQEPAAELESLKLYKKAQNGCCLLCDLVKVEVALKSRIVSENDDWICIVPFWAVWPFETMVLPKTHLSCITTLNQSQKESLATILQKITCKYDNLFETSFPYSMGLHNSPAKPTQENCDLMHLHFHFYPPLLRSATIKKFLVGYEMMAQAQRDLTAEQAADRLRVLPEIHYRRK